MNGANKQFPFETLGEQLKNLREKCQETLVETSGAVEIEPEVLTSIESGLERPSEDILLLLISHFSAKEDIASKLWQLAGYDQDELPSQNFVNNADIQASSVTVMPAEARVVYTDMVHVLVNNYGVVMNFMQTTGPNNQPLAVSRVGMSKEHAQSVLEVLQKTLALHQPQILPKPENSQTPNETTEK